MQAVTLLREKGDAKRLKNCSVLSKSGYKIIQSKILVLGIINVLIAFLKMTPKYISYIKLNSF